MEPRSIVNDQVVKISDEDRSDSELLSYAFRLLRDIQSFRKDTLCRKGEIVEIYPCSENSIRTGDLVLAALTTESELLANQGYCEVDIWYYKKIRSRSFLVSVLSSPRSLKEEFVIIGKVRNKLTEAQAASMHLVKEVLDTNCH